jgi:hypothetical protein
LTILSVCTAQTLTAQSGSQQSPTQGQPAGVSSQPGTRRSRVDLTAGFADVRVRELPPRDGVGQGALSLFVSAGYLWAPYLVTQVDIASQVEPFNWDYAHERVLALGRTTNITLKHNYDVRRWTVAQILQLGRRRLQPYLGAGVGVESQTTYDTWYQSNVVLGPDATTVAEFPNASTGEKRVDHLIAFGLVGAKMFVGSHAYLLVDWRFATGDTGGSGMFGVGVRLP